MTSARLSRVTGVIASVDVSTERASVSAPVQVCARPDRRDRGGLWIREMIV